MVIKALDVLLHDQHAVQTRQTEEAEQTNAPASHRAKQFKSAEIAPIRTGPAFARPASAFGYQLIYRRPFAGFIGSTPARRDAVGASAGGRDYFIIKPLFTGTIDRAVFATIKIAERFRCIVYVFAEYRDDVITVTSHLSSLNKMRPRGLYRWHQMPTGDRKNNLHTGLPASFVVRAVSAISAPGTCRNNKSCQAKL